MQVSEYMVFASPKTRLEDQRYIEAFDLDEFDKFLQNNEEPTEKED